MSEEELFVRALSDEDLAIRSAAEVPAVLRDMQGGDVSQLHAVYADAFSGRPGVRLCEEVWVARWPQHPQCVPRLSTVATVEGMPVGYLLAYLDPEAPEEGYIGQVGVRTEWQRRGVGSHMLLRTLRAFRAEALAFAALRVARDNVLAIALYRRLGFRPNA
jgi:ribosomal protein S18 acetylase RimI-like enzyme